MDTNQIVDPSAVKVEWVIRCGDITADIVDPYAGMEEDAPLTAERGDCLRCMGTGYPRTPGSSHDRGGKCFRCNGTGGKRETSTVAAERARISTHPAVLAKLMNEISYLLENRHRFTDADLAKSLPPPDPHPSRGGLDTEAPAPPRTEGTK